MKIGQILAITALSLTLGTLAWSLSTQIDKDWLPIGALRLDPIERTARSLRYAGERPSSIEVRNLDKVVLDPDFEGVELLGDTNLTKLFSISLHGSKLELKMASMPPEYLDSSDYMVRIGVKNLRSERNLELKFYLVNSVTCANPLDFDRIKWDVREVVHTELDVNCAYLEIQHSYFDTSSKKHTQCKIKIEGRADLVNFGLASYINCDLRNLIVKNCYAGANRINQSTLQFGSPELINIKSDTSTKINFLREPRFKKVWEGG